ncbi:MAG: ribonuclease BN [Gallionellales bacterium GWA2_59_43]|nr:MAG: ribonuclease BN [Gallionellales bacterium GWA2_59_43]
MQKDSRDFADFMRFIVTRFDQDRCAQIAGSLTFTTLLSLVPLFTIALTLFSAFPVFEDYSSQIKRFLIGNLMPDMATKVITHYMTQFTESAMRLTALGIGLLAVAAMFLLLTIEHAFNTIWRVTVPRPLFKRLIIHWAALTLAPLLVGASLALTSWLVGLSMGYVRHVPVFGVGVLKLLPVMLTWLAFAMLFHFVPNRHVPRSHAMIGALVAAFAFEAMNQAFGYYVSHFPTYKLVYGAFASVPIFLMWIYLSWLSILIGAVIAASLSYWRTPMAKDASPTAQLLDALRVLQVMTEGLREGRVSSLPELSRSLRLSYDTLEEVLDKLEQADMIRKVKGDGWLMMRDAAHIRTAELLRLFVLDGASSFAGQDGEPLRQWLADSAIRLEQGADMSLQELFLRSPA